MKEIDTWTEEYGWEQREHKSVPDTYLGIDVIII